MGGDRMILATGGTGGHIYPALSVGLEGVKRGWRPVFFLGPTRRDFSLPFPVLSIPAAPFVGLRMRGWLQLPLHLLGAMKAGSLMADIPGHAVTVSTGSYGAVPTLLAALLTGIPIYLLEQNRVPGETVRLFSRFSRAVFTAFPDTHLPRAVYTGTPVRPLQRPDRRNARRRFGLPPDAPVVLVLGGSQGARRLARTALLVARKIPGMHFLVSAGRFAGELVPKAPPNAHVVAYIEDMGAAYVAADLVLSRAGGSTLAEIACFGLPAILVPYPYATGGHQEANARFFAEAGAAVLLPEEALSPETLERALLALIEDEKRRREMAEAMRRLARPRAAADILDLIEEAIQR